MSFFTNAIDVLQTLVIALGGGLCVWGGINLLEGYGQDNPASKSQGIKQLMAGGGVALIGITSLCCPVCCPPPNVSPKPAGAFALQREPPQRR